MEIDEAEVDISVVIEDAEILPTIAPVDGEFSNFPEISKKTVEVLTAKGYVNLFPI